MSTVVPVRAIAFLSLAAFASAATLRATDPLLPQIAAEFGTTTGSAGRVVTAFAVSYGLLQIAFGPLAERWGKYLFVTVMTALCAVGALLCAASGSLDALAAARLLSGATAGPLIPISMAFIGDAVPYAQRQRVLARFLAGQILGVALGQVIGGFVGERYGWRAPFLFLAGLYLVAATCLLLEWRRNPSVRARPAAASAPGAGYFATIGVVLRRPWPRTLLAIVAIEGFAIYGPFPFIAAHLHEAFGVSLAAAGAVVACFALGGLAFAFAVSPLVARLRERGLAGLGGAVLFFAYGGLAFAPAVWAVVPLMFLLGFGYYMLHNTLQTNATQMAPEARGVGMSLFATAFFTGQSLGVAASAIAVDTVGAQAAFAVAGLMLLALAFEFRRRLGARPRSAA